MRTAPGGIGPRVVRLSLRSMARSLPLLLLFAAWPSLATTPVGVWINEKQTVAVRVAPCDTALCGRIVWLAKPFRKDGTLKRDEGRPLCGLTVMQGFRPGEDGSAWLEGSVYDPASSTNYRGRMQLTDADTLEVRGYALVSLFGRTVVWRRRAEPPGACPVSAPAAP